MRTASVKHVLRAGLRSALTRTLAAALAAALALSSAAALASTSSVTGGAAPSGPQTIKKALATWFGPGFYGSTTACGQKMTRKLIGVASRTLPCGTLVQIAYGGHQVTVPVVDRGPYGHIGAKWDLTAGAARALQVTETVRVVTEIVGSLPNTPTLGEPAPEASPEQPSAEGGPAAAAASTGGAVAR